jgi:NAD(P)-dependent dehydrogenase (short-subunit alcohol dehydrogenase family)
VLTPHFVRNRGKATVAGLASRGARVYMGARNADKAREAIEDIRQSLAKPEADILFLPLDLQDFASVREAAELVKSFVTCF